MLAAALSVLAATVLAGCGGSEPSAERAPDPLPAAKQPTPTDEASAAAAGSAAAGGEPTVATGDRANRPSGGEAGNRDQAASAPERSARVAASLRQIAEGLGGSAKGTTTKEVSLAEVAKALRRSAERGPSEDGTPQLKQLLDQLRKAVAESAPGNDDGGESRSQEQK